MFDKKQKSCVTRIHLVTDDGLYDQKAFYEVKFVFYSTNINDGEFINYYFRIHTQTTNNIYIYIYIYIYI